MAYYDALTAKWATLTSTTTAAKLAEINADTVAGPNQDVSVGSVEALLSIDGVLTAMEDFVAANPAPVSNPTTAAVRVCANELLRTINSPHISSFVMSDPTTYAKMSASLSALEAAGLLTSDQVTQVLGLAATTVPWWQSAGYTSEIGQGDLDAAGGLS